MRDLNDLHFFAAVVAHGGFSPAARALDLPKSRISRRVSALEAQLGVRLIERSTRRFNVTEVGQEVYRHARAALAEADAIQEVASRLKAEPQGLIRVSCPLGAERIIAAALPQFLKQYPRLRVQMVVTNRRVDLIDEGVDIAIRVRDKLDTDADMQVKILGHSGSILVASPAFLEEHGRPMTLTELVSLPTLSHTERPGIDRWTLIDDAGNEAVATHEPRLATGDFAILRQAAIEGAGVAFLPELWCREALEDGRLQRILPQWSSRAGVLHLIFTSRRGLLPGVRAFIDFAAEAFSPSSAVWEA
jgi:DNA-binding transcriptional LysR family regulator